MIRVALALAGIGWRVHPLQVRGKRPLTSHGCLDASTDEQVIREWWTRWPRANIGIATGAESDIIVLDVDGPEGWLSWAQLCSEHGEPVTLSQQTGRLEGGQQLFFSHPGGRVKNGREVRPGLDCRADGGYIVAPPSIHPSGRRYRWLRRMRPAPCPSWLVELIRPPERPAHPVPPPRRGRGGGSTSYGMVALERSCAEARCLGRGQRAMRLFHLASCVGELVAGGELDREAAQCALTAAGVESGLSEREAARQVRCGLTAGEKNPRGSP